MRRFTTMSVSAFVWLLSALFVLASVIFALG